MAHHWVQPWQVEATHSPLAGPAALAFRSAIALVTGISSPVVAQPAAIALANATDALMNSLLVSFMCSSPSPLASSGGTRLIPPSYPRENQGVWDSGLFQQFTNPET